MGIHQKEGVRDLFGLIFPTIFKYFGKKQGVRTPWTLPLDPPLMKEWEIACGTILYRDPGDSWGSAKNGVKY